jgi:hypothetical protein
MSLNKFTTSTDYLQKQYLNIGCNRIDCSVLDIAGEDVFPNGFGTYVPTITVDDGSTIQTPIVKYTKIGNSNGTMIDLSLNAEMTPLTSTSTYRLTISLPENFKCFFSQTISAVGKIHNKGGAYSNYTPIFATTVVDSTTILVEFNTETATFLPVGVGANYVNANVKLVVKK